MQIAKITLLFSLFSLYTFGLVVLFSTTSAEVLDLRLALSSYHSTVKQLMYGALGALLALALYRVGYRTFFQVSPLLLALSMLLLLLVLIPGIGREVNGSKRWLGVGPLSLQPSEFVKVLLVTFFIYDFSRLKEQRKLFEAFLITLGKSLLPLALILLEPNNGTVAAMAISLVVTFILLGIPFKYWGAPLLALLSITPIFASQLPYVQGRLKVYIYPELDIRGRGHQPYQAKIAAGSGALFGKGPGKSLQEKWLPFPEAQNDYIAAIIGEEYGYMGILAIIALYALFACSGFLIASKAADPQAAALGGALVFLISFQAFMNLAVVSGLLPSTGLNLPFVSQGGSSLMANFLGVALLFSIANRSGDQNKKWESVKKN